MNSTCRTGQAVDDPLRLEALAEADLLDTLSEESFDRFTRVAKKVLRADVSLLSLVDLERQFFKSQTGLPAPYDSERQTPLSHSFCKLVVETGQPLIIEDARLDERVSENLGIRDLGVISYLGIPVKSDDGFLLGSFCAINSTPRKWSSVDQELLEDLAAMVSTEIQVRQLASSLRDAIAILEDAERLRKSAAGMLIHDMRTPATGILSSLELLESSLPKFGPEQTELFQMARDSATLLNTMIGDMAAERLSSEPSTQSIPVSTILRRSARMIRPMIQQHGLTLDVQFPSGGGEIRNVDVLDIERVLLNLLTNAVKFSPEKGRVSLSAQRCLDEDRPGIRFEVSDCGPGVPEAERTEIFREGIMGSAPRLRGPKSYGLGLAFCESAVRRHGGTMGVENAPGGGSTFYFVLPQER